MLWVFSFGIGEGSCGKDRIELGINGGWGGVDDCDDEVDVSSWDMFDDNDMPKIKGEGCMVTLGEEESGRSAEFVTRGIEPEFSQSTECWVSIWCDDCGRGDM